MADMVEVGPTYGETRPAASFICIIIILSERATERVQTFENVVNAIVCFNEILEELGSSHIRPRF